ncbi:MAG: hypothetical protein ACYTHM_00390 [Planctomycetota bacterium]|jgi:hypothetical protein
MKREMIFWGSLVVVLCLGFSLPALGQEGDAGPADAVAPADKPGKAESEIPAAGKPEGKSDHESRAEGGRRLPKSLAGAISLLAGVSVIILSGFSLFAFLFLIVIVFPSMVLNVRERQESKPGMAFFLGLVNILFVCLLLGALAQGKAVGGLLAGLILLAFLMVVVLGLSGRAQNLGSRAMVLAERKPNVVVNLAIGWWVIFLVGIIPVVGWVLFLYWSISGVGSVLLSIFGGGKGKKAPPESEGLVIDGPDYTA